MKIASSNIALASQHQAVTRYEKKETLRAWVGERRPDFEAQERAAFGQRRARHRDRVQLSEAATSAAPAKALQEGEEGAAENDVRVQLLRRLVEKMTGKKIRLLDPKVCTEGCADSNKRLQDIAQLRSRGPQRAGFGVEYDAQASYYEAETTTFAAAGTIRTQDGQEIAINVSLTMSRQFLEEQAVRWRAGDARLQDPLVINFNGNAAQLTTTTFAFDIDQDGQDNQIAFVQPGSGFLALDANNDGLVNDGSELFGAITRDGFGELAAYDTDSNQWIDEQDSVYQRLRIWVKDGSGKDQLLALGEQGIGAIYLGHIATAFDVKDTSNTLQGRITDTGLYLNEDGSAGTIQKIDLVV